MISEFHIYEYSVITADTVYALSDLVTQAISMNQDCQPWGGIVAYKEHTEGGEQDRYAQAMVYVRRYNQ